MDPVIIENYQNNISFIVSKYAPEIFINCIVNPSQSNLDNLPDEWKDNIYFQNVGLIPNAIMYYSILELYKQKTNDHNYNIWDQYPETPIQNDNGTYMINPIFNEFFQMYAPKEVLESLEHNRKLCEDKDADHTSYIPLPNDYAHLEKLYGIGLGYPVFLESIFKEIKK